MKRKKFIKDFIASDEKGVYALFGEGGTGKSTCIKKIVKDLGETVVVVTFTHAAKNRLKSDGVHAVTAHSFLESNPRTNFFAPTSENAEEFKYTAEDGKIDTVIIDEYSMMPKKMLRAIKKTCTKMLLVGDPAQLPPVKGVGISVERLKERSVMYYTLTVNHRQNSQELLDLCRDVRETGELVCDTPDIEKEFLDDISLDKVFLTYRNDDVERISKKLSPDATPGLEVITHTGFQFWAYDPSHAYEKLFNGDRLIIEDILYGCPNLDIGGHTPFNAYRDKGFTMVTFVGLMIPFVPVYMGTMKSYRPKYIDPMFRNLKELAEQLAVVYGITGDYHEKNKILWDKYKYNKLKPEHTRLLSEAYHLYKQALNVLVCTDARVCTVHKAQGLGFDHVYINSDGLDSKQSYVAITRAKEKVFVGSLRNDT